VNGSLGGTTKIGTDGTLMGNGTMGNVIVANGGTIAPGNSIGTLHSTGTITFASGSTYNVQLNSAGQSDLITTTGAATINGGTVVVSNGNVFNNSHIYTILTAAGGVTGQFSALTTPFSRVFLTYDADDVYLKYIPSLGVTRNEIGAASGLQSLGMGAVYNAVTAISDANAANQALDQVSGEIHASAKTALIEDSKFLSDAANERLRGSFGSQPTSTTGALSYADASNAETDQDQFPFKSLKAVEVDRPVGWGRVFGSQAKGDSDTNAATLTYSTGGLLAGVDGSIDAWRIGFMTGYSNTSFNADQRGSGSSSNYHLGIYGGRVWGPLAFRSMMSMTLNDINTNRAVAIPGFSDNLKAQYYAETLQAFGELGYQITEPLASTEPFINVAYVGLHTQGFSEVGGAAALSAAAEMTNTGFSTLGIRQSLDLSGGPFDTINGSIGWRHAYGDTIPISVNSFSGSGAFVVAGVPISRDAAVIELGVAVNPLPTTSFSISYFGQIAGNATNQGITAKYASKF
jgi:outer membrane autotransporter protein